MSLRAFSLATAIERVSWTDKVRTIVECLESCGRHLYVGTRDSLIIRYLLEEKSQPNGNILFYVKQQTQKYLEFKKPIMLLKAISALNRILLLCDGNLVVLDMFNLEIVQSMSKLKGVTYFCVNENPMSNNPFSVEICIGKRKQLQIHHVTEDKVIHIRDVNIPEQPVLMSMDGQYICVALISKYVIVDATNSCTQELFSYDVNCPLVKRITKEEFLLKGPAIGMFVTIAGISERPPLLWGEDIVSVAYAHPYLIALGMEFLTVYSILDQQPKQRIPFQGGCYLDNFDGKIYVCSSDAICALIPVPWEKQVQALLDERKVNEALELARYSNKAGLTKEQSRKILQTIQQKAGFIEFSSFHFDKAKELFCEGHLDVRELISLYPRLMPTNSSFSRANPPLHDIANVHEMCSLDKDQLVFCHDLLLQFLEDVRGTSEAVGYKLEVDTALLKLYAERNSPKLLSFIESIDMGCNSKEGLESLMQHKRYNALAVFHCKLGENHKALSIWSKIIDGEYVDKTFPGLSYMVQFLCKLNDYQLVWKYADFVLEQDQELGVKIFIDRPVNSPSERMRPDVIAESLHRFPIAIVRYLEHLVFEKKLEKEKFHTHLAVLYLDNVLEQLIAKEQNESSLKESRKKLQHLLLFSTLYRVQILLEKALDNQLYIECAILYGRLEEHEKALRILVHKLQDHSAAEYYCIRMSEGKEQKLRHRLFHTLLGVYLDPDMSEEQREDMLAPAVQLLNSDVAEFDAAKVLQLIPPNWSIAIVDQFLNKALRSTLHHRYSSRLQSALSRGVNLQIKFTKIYLESTPIILTDDRLCAACRRPFQEPSFVRYPNGVITHPQCAKQNALTQDMELNKHEDGVR